MKLRLAGLLERASPEVEADAGLDLAAGFGSTLAQIHDDLGGAVEASTLVARLGQVLSQMAADGHACVALDQLQQMLAADPDLAPAVDAAAQMHLLTQSPALGQASVLQLSAPDAVVIYERQRFYLQRYWRYEVRLAERLNWLDRSAEVSDLQVLHHALAQFFVAGDEVNWQLVAAATVLLRHLSVITGGPGTGKTTTVARVLAVLLRIAPDSRIALAAPTGKAALRLQQAIAGELAMMLEIADGFEPAALKTLTQLKAQTLHRLLGARPGHPRTRYDRLRPMPFDLVIVDEASMLDLALASKLVDALGPSARLVLLGDADQLSSVETGTVFAELASLEGRDAGFAADLATLCDASPRQLAVAPERLQPMGNAVVRLTHSYRYRQDGALGRLADAVRTGQRDLVDTMLQGEHDGLAFRDIADHADTEALALQLVTGFEPLLGAIERASAPIEVLARLGDHGVLCALRRGPLGAYRINAALSRLAAQRLGASVQDVWFKGRVVMVTRNDPMLGLFNGDVGVALPSDGVLMVHFPGSGEETRAIAPARLAEAETAYAVTVHKAQGSEFDRVDVVLPRPESPLASRELLYTAITRARHSVTLWGDPRTLGVATGRPTRRHSALAERLREGDADAS